MKQRKFLALLCIVVLAISSIGMENIVVSKTVQAAKEEYVSIFNTDNYDTNKKGLTYATKVSKDKVKTNQKHSTVVGNKYGFVKPFNIPKSWRGNWYDKNGLAQKLTANAYNIEGIITNRIWIVGKVKGTNKYPWQIADRLNKKYPRAYIHDARGTWRYVSGLNLIITSPVTEKSVIKDGFAFTCHKEQVSGEVQSVYFDVNAKTGKVKDQLFKTKQLAKEYAHHKFSDMHYSSKFK
ncbi:hypothetical protein OZX58_00780 [Lactobacillus sp. ESL0680]|uniref:hypothetical protein n=1 Tax=Lactobacillus sp. ESL0680 TaxID=2983210 RepID=UPI0023F8437A|nr:hypothetical protein [Lactobacillus sp. ESL0680]WEV38840.1 hypothetical protein OZX58_00780 [Lactobacillus sp. ESL0680]